MADLSVTIGADTTELEKKAKSAGKTLKKELSPGQEAVMGGINFASNLMSGNVGTAIGGLFGKVGEAVGSFIDTLIGKVGELMERSRELRNLSIATGLSVKELEGLENLAKVTGTSLNTLSNSFAEFNLKLGQAKIRGSELNAALAKMGVNYQDVINGTFTATDGLKKLADAYTAGTDDQTLAYYGNLMYGSSFKDLLPIIKQGSVAIDTHTKLMYKSTKAYDDANAAFLNAMSNLKNSLLNILTDITGSVFLLIDSVRVKLNQLIAKFEPWTDKKVKAFIEDNPTMTSKEILEKAKNKEEVSKYYAFGMSDKEYKDFIEETKKQVGGNGVKLNPFGGGPAQGASQMQQIGGGDLFGAVTFSPMQETAKNTGDTVTELKKISASGQTPLNPQRDNLNR
jgi:hypothetical protein